MRHERIDRFQLAIAAIDRTSGLATYAAAIKRTLDDRLGAHALDIPAHGERMPDITGWACLWSPQRT